VSNTVRLLELAEDMQESLVRGHITAGHAKVLLSVEDENEQRLLFEKIAEENLSVRDLETTRDLEVPDRGKKGKPKRKPKEKKPNLVSLEEELAEALGVRVRIRERGGKGVVAIDFYSKEGFERLRALLLSGLS
jgi:ParB family chromosome partitioning protein